MVQHLHDGHARGARPLTRSPGPAWVLAVDVGTSATRVRAVSLTGQTLAAARRPTTSHHAGDRAELDPAQLAEDIFSLIREVVESVGAAPQAISIACQLGLVLVDEGLQPVLPALLWADRRAAAEAAQLSAALGSLSTELAGRSPAAEHTAPRLAWVARHEPAAWARTRWVLGLKDYLVTSLTGVPISDPASASYSLLYEVRRGAWSEPLCDAAGVPIDRLPPVHGGAEVAGTIDPDTARRMGLPRDVQVAVGGPDGSVAVVGSGGAVPGTTVDVAGSTDVVLHVLDRPPADLGGGSILNAFVLPGLWTAGGPTGLTGGAVGWLAGLLGHASVEELARDVGPAAAALPPGADGVTFHTTLGGERFPTWDSTRAGTIAGLRPSHGPAHLLRAADEGAAFEVREGLDALRELGLSINEVRIVGGVGASATSVQLRADAWGLPVVAGRDPEATMIGAAILAATACGASPSVEAAAAVMAGPTRTFGPDRQARDAWDRAYRRWQVGRVVGDV